MYSNPDQSKYEDRLSRVTTRLYGQARKSFFEEVQKTKITESELARKIISEHYDKKTKDDKK